MEEKSRTYNVVRNSSVALTCQIINLIVGFVSKTIFTKLLGSEYLGVQSLFTNILTILSFAELGLGSAFVYRLYQPLASDNHEKIRQYLQLYKKIYHYIVGVIVGSGIILIPFIQFIIKAPQLRENLIVLYLLYLFDTAITYIYVYKKSLLIADQKDYVVSLITQFMEILKSLVQIFFLLKTRNFYVFISVRIISNFAINLICGFYVDRHYKYIQEPVSESLSAEEKAGLKKDAKGLLLTNIASTIFGGTDNIFISKFIGIGAVGILSAYLLFINFLTGLMNKIFYVMTSSLGNLIVDVEQDHKRVEKVLQKMIFLNTWCYSFFCIAFIFLLKDFITNVWLSPEFYLPTAVVGAVLIELYLRGVHYPVYIARNAGGDFSSYKIVFALMAVLNIFLDFLLVKPWGIFGLYVATILCRSVTYYIDIYVVYHDILGISVIHRFKRSFAWVLFDIVNIILIYFCFKYIPYTNLWWIIIKGFIVLGVYLLLTICFFYKWEEFLYFKDLLKTIKERIG